MIGNLQSFLVGAGVWALVPVFLIVTLESAAFVGLMFPGEAAALIAGTLSAKGVFPLWCAVAAVAGGAIVGDIAGYTLAFYLGESALRKWQIAWRQYDRRRAQLETYFRKWGVATVLIGRFVAAGRVFVPFMAGLSGMAASRFIPMAVVSGLVWGVLVAVLGYTLGAKWRMAGRWLNSAGGTILVIFLLILLVVWLHRMKRSSPSPA
jgi:membrane protein DedA with SNARE-associated domain